MSDTDIMLHNKQADSFYNEATDSNIYHINKIIEKLEDANQYLNKLTTHSGDRNIIKNKVLQLSNQLDIEKVRYQEIGKCFLSYVDRVKERDTYLCGYINQLFVETNYDMTIEFREQMVDDYYVDSINLELEDSFQFGDMAVFLAVQEFVESGDRTNQEIIAFVKELQKNNDGTVDTSVFDELLKELKIFYDANAGTWEGKAKTGEGFWQGFCTDYAKKAESAFKKTAASVKPEELSRLYKQLNNMEKDYVRSSAFVSKNKVSVNSSSYKLYLKRQKEFYKVSDAIQEYSDEVYGAGSVAKSAEELEKKVSKFGNRVMYLISAVEVGCAAYDSIINEGMDWDDVIQDVGVAVWLVGVPLAVGAVTATLPIEFSFWASAIIGYGASYFAAKTSDFIGDKMDDLEDWWEYQFQW
ncbi:hypothetical protein [Anaeromicropila populeti]|uniref:Uncharacterized protein n=1 Tax=Anaeromicropila populeti TaxID=37658 RepID=A0A1I6JP55_9FIRM|nr:hypothetical protein [Anaeromicropila populeti]SFR80767.1 hypothetical protein SAMN05661086_01829 [Anaeromicropila populeti]